MLTEERYQIILETLKKKGIVKIHELVKLTNTSESTIRRDLTYLESINQLKRIHGGATLLKGRFNEPSYSEKQIQNIDKKSVIAKYAASLIDEGDCIYLDAGTTTYEVIKYIDKKDIVVVTNGLKHIDELIERNISAYILGGKIKARTKAVIGSDALKNLEKFRFDKCFIGINGIHPEYGFTTPDSEEAILKETAINLSREVFVLADESKFGEVAFVKVADLRKAEIITNEEPEDLERYMDKTKVKVVTE
ncbi:transcriptional regulator, DeoR family [Caminicella sporogenes DSM 14501]|uniref:Transcriptional regulator, DeoR family n=1 Tax=Caminicella sporogenes DSM 14501 TaxID=1121266 RepID=A0A1M6PGN3_9FIRM|nr:DeoR/GlpR family DNA-binding transcription regulator [Caminicella sporogenes]RKD21406.1 DeoR family transcriptional regulator [Caminicella sporogenes]WIF96139.1 DeoR/GlpR family DNA-binding transcription regulator [Caminicella sporogenes]SHK07093.1 transcriptional regulator, DeoR family [Caminicella sporogenes DSM 14501]